jgi:hypothetical protein
MALWIVTKGRRRLDNKVDHELVEVTKIIILIESNKA